MVTRAAAIALALLPACLSSSTSDGSGADACAAALVAGHGGAAAFVPYADGDSAEIVLGFQGFLFLDLTLRVGGIEATEARVTAQADIEGLATSWINQTMPLAEGPGPERYAEELLLFFNTSSLADLLGRRGTFTFGIDEGGCRASERLDLVLVDLESCVAQPDGGLLCNDGG
jgi:hypothetical protein